MGNQVYANSMEVSCKAADGKSIAAFPDVCFTPPENPATPPGVPIPYPNNGMASDCTDGSQTVKVSGQEVMLKDKSYFKQSSGDEAGSAAKKGVITSKNMGKVFFTMWSMDVKIEGENVVRHLDMTTHNHASQPPNSPPWAYMDALAADTSQQCKEQSEKTKQCVEKHVKKNTHQQQRKDFRTPGSTQVAAAGDNTKVNWTAMVEADGGAGRFYNKKGATEDMCKDEECKGQMECSLVPFDFGCCGDKTPHHIVPAHCFLPSGERKSGAGDRYPGTDEYDDTKAPCICVEGGTKSDSDAAGKLKQHGRIHEIVDVAEDSYMKVETTVGPRGGVKTKKTAGTWTFEQANEAGADAASKVKPECSKECMKKQCEAAHQRMGLDVGEGKSDKLALRADSSGNRTPAGFVPGGAVSAPMAD
jgi:hypothetical protein